MSSLNFTPVTYRDSHASLMSLIQHLNLDLTEAFISHYGLGIVNNIRGGLVEGPNRPQTHLFVAGPGYQPWSGIVTIVDQTVPARTGLTNVDYFELVVELYPYHEYNPNAKWNYVRQFQLSGYAGMFITELRQAILEHFATHPHQWPKLDLSDSPPITGHAEFNGGL